MKYLKIGITIATLSLGSISGIACPTPTLTAYPALHGYYICLNDKTLEERMYFQENAFSFDITYTGNVDGFGGPGIIEQQSLSKKIQNPITIVKDQFVGSVHDAIAYCNGDKQIVLEGDTNDPVLGTVHMTRSFQFANSNSFSVTASFKDQSGVVIGTANELKCHN